MHGLLYTRTVDVFEVVDERCTCKRSLGVPEQSKLWWQRERLEFESVYARLRDSRFMQARVARAAADKSNLSRAVARAALHQWHTSSFAAAPQREALLEISYDVLSTLKCSPASHRCTP